MENIKYDRDMIAANKYYDFHYKIMLYMLEPTFGLSLVIQ